MGQIVTFCACLPSPSSRGENGDNATFGGALPSTPAKGSPFNTSMFNSPPELRAMTPELSVANDTSGEQVHPGDTIGDFQLLQKIGDGHFSNVFIAKDVRDGSPCAAKVMHARSLREDSLRGYDYRNEIAIHAAMDHENIIRLREYSVEYDRATMVMDAACGGTLRDYIVAEEYLEEEDARRVMRQLVPAISYCHSRGVYHRDIKPENILLTGFGEIRLCDFGLATSVDVVGKRLRGRSGTKEYVAPEVLWGVDEWYDGRKSDSFSVGVVLYAMVHGAIPFGRKRGDDGTAQRDCDLVFEDDVSEDLRELIRGLLHPDPQLRLEMQDVMSHPWYAFNPPQKI